MKTKRGRPKGLSGKYRDKNGKPISVMAWRKQNKDWKDLKPNYAELHSEQKRKISLLASLLGLSKDQIIDESLKLLVKERLK